MFISTNNKFNKEFKMRFLVSKYAKDVAIKANIPTKKYTKKIVYTQSCGCCESKCKSIEGYSVKATINELKEIGLISSSIEDREILI